MPERVTRRSFVGTAGAAAAGPVPLRSGAASYGFKEEDLLTPESRRLWLEWRTHRGKDDDWLDVPEKEPMVARPTGTINLKVVNAQGDVPSVTTTSGLAWKAALRDTARLHERQS